jgi:hypothetical protein
MEYIAFTTNFGDYDNLPVPYIVGKGWYKVLFTDSDKPQKRGFDKVIVLPKTDRPDLQAKKIKWGIHNYFPDAKLYLHYDGNMVIRVNLPKEPFRITHPKRLNVLQEAHACNAQVHRFSKEAVSEHYNMMIYEDYPDNNGLYLNGLHCRENSETENKIGDEVIAQMEKYTSRDQIAFPYVLWKNNHTYPKEQLKDFVFFSSVVGMIKHKRNQLPIQKEVETSLSQLPPLQTPKTVYYFTPASADKNFGRACNLHCESVPNDDDWICLRDADTTFLTPDYSKIIEGIVAQHGHKYDLIGCYTNRIGLNYQQHNGILSEDTDIRNHINIAKMLQDKYGTEVSTLNKNIAGFFLLFPKKAWKEHKFEEGLYVTKKDYDGKTRTGYIDYWFSNYFARKKRVGIAKGLYVFHVYRLFAPNRMYQEHLR